MNDVVGRPSQDHEPDYRFTFANERTYLAWIRTALALDAAGLAVVGFLPPTSVPLAREALALSLLGLGTLMAAFSLRQWSLNQVALRQDAPLPRSPMLPVLSVGVVAATLVAVFIAITGMAT